mgnify:CR=1 FL=1
MIFPEIPNNSLTNRIKTIIELSEEIIKDNVKGVFKFCASISEEEIESWEKENGIKIPESYKDWLRFSKSATIRGTAATFYEPKDFITDNDKKSYDVPDECIVIGELGGWGVSVCFYAETE